MRKQKAPVWRDELASLAVINLHSVEVQVYQHDGAWRLTCPQLSMTNHAMPATVLFLDEAKREALDRVASKLNHLAGMALQAKR